MSDPSLPALPVSNVSFHSSRLPGDWFSMKSMLLLVPALQLQTQTCLLGLRAYLLSSSSSPPLPPFLSFLFPFFKPSQASASLCLRSLSSFKSRQVGPNSLAVFLSFLSTSLFSFHGCSLFYPSSFYLSVSSNWAERDPWSTILKEERQLWCVFHTQTHSAPWIRPAVCTYKVIH